MECNRELLFFILDNPTSSLVQKTYEIYKNSLFIGKGSVSKMEPTTDTGELVLSLNNEISKDDYHTIVAYFSKILNLERDQLRIINKTGEQNSEV